MTPEEFQKIESLVAGAANAIARNVGRLPLYFAGKPITFRLPYEIPGQMLIDLRSPVVLPTSKTFPEATFLHNVDKPFEIHRLIPRITAIHTVVDPQSNNETNEVIMPQPAIGSGLERFVRLRVKDTSKNENLTKIGGSIETMTRANSRVWEFDDVYTLVRSEGLEIDVDVVNFTPNPLFLPTVGCVDGAPVAGCTSVDQLLIDIVLQGALLVVAPPSEQR